MASKKRRRKTIIPDTLGNNVAGMIAMYRQANKSMQSPSRDIGR